MSAKLDPAVAKKVQMWLDGPYDDDTKRQVNSLIENDKKELIESFYKDLEFGTGGLRGIMGVGTNRMNIYTIGMATQGLSNYLKKTFLGKKIKVAVAHDSRNNSRLFAERVAAIFAGNGFEVFLFDALRPTPELSFAIRELKCHSGVVVTASHNPKEYNGYKAYWSDGAQVVAPHDTNIIAEVEKIHSPQEVIIEKDQSKITILDEKFDAIYLERIHSLSLCGEAVAAHSDIKIVYTPIHGAGVRLVPASLRKYGFKNIILVDQQCTLDGNFPTVASPNPEEQATMSMAIDLAKQEHADLVLATDPDSDRIGIAVRDNSGEYILLNGNQTCMLLLYYMVRRYSELGRLRGNEYVIKTIVTTEIIARIAESFGIQHYDCLTGFKYIATIIREQEGKSQYICGGEESFGFLAGDYVRDKDAVSACSMAAEAAAWAQSRGMTLLDVLKEIYLEYGLYQESVTSVVRKGIEGAQQITQMMHDFRTNPPKSIDGSTVVMIRDYQESTISDLTSGQKTPLTLEKSNVLQFLTENQTILSIRPSGTEPKIKFYFGVRGELKDPAAFGDVQKELENRIERIKKELRLI